jgi:hypothetical protein
LGTFGNLWEPLFLGTFGNPCSGTFTMGEDPKLTLLGKRVAPPSELKAVFRVFIVSMSMFVG